MSSKNSVQSTQARTKQQANTSTRKHTKHYHIQLFAMLLACAQKLSSGIAYFEKAESGNIKQPCGSNTPTDFVRESPPDAAGEPALASDDSTDIAIVHIWAEKV